MAEANFVLRMIDRVTGPANGVLARLDAINRSVNRTGGGFGGFARQGEVSARRAEMALMRLQARTDSVSRGFGRMRTAGMGMFGALAAGAAGAGVFGLGKMILEGAGQRESNLSSLGALLKTKDRTVIRGAADWIGNFADVTPFEDRAVMSAVKQLLSYRFSMEETKGLARITGDAASALAENPEEAAFKWQVINRALGQIRGKGRLQGGEVLQLSEAGVGAVDYLKTAFGPNYEKMQQAGQISGAAAVKAITEGLQRDFGGAMETKSSEYLGLLSTLKSRPQRIFDTLFDKGGLRDAKRFMLNLVNITDFSKEPGSRILDRATETMLKLTSAIFGPLADATQGDAAVRSVDTLLSKLDDVSAWWAKNGPGINANAGGFVEGFTGKMETFGQVLTPISKAWGFMDRLQGGSGEGGLGKALGMVAGGLIGMKVLNAVTFGGAAKLGAFVGKAALGATQRGMQTVISRTPWMMEFLTNPRGRMAGARGAGRLIAQGARTRLLAGAMNATLIGASLAPVLARVGGWFSGLMPLFARFSGWFAQIGLLFGRFAPVLTRLIGLAGPIGLVVSAAIALGQAMEALMGTRFMKNLTQGEDGKGGTQAWFSRLVRSLPGGERAATALGLREVDPTTPTAKVADRAQNSPFTTPVTIPGDNSAWAKAYGAATVNPIVPGGTSLAFAARTVGGSSTLDAVSAPLAEGAVSTARAVPLGAVGTTTATAPASLTTIVQYGAGKVTPEDEARIRAAAEAGTRRVLGDYHSSLGLEGGYSANGGASR